MPTVVLLQGVAVELSGGHRLFRASPPLNVTLDLYNQSLVDAGIIGVVDPDVPGPPVPAYDELVAVHVGSGGSIPTGSSPVRQSDGTWAPLVESIGDAAVTPPKLATSVAPSGKQILSYDGASMRWRNRDWANAVEDYGFVSGAVDNTAAMTAMLAAAPRNIFFPPGVYVVDSFALSTSRQNWFGANAGSFNEGATGGRSVIKLKDNGTTHLLTRPAGILNVHFTDLSFDGNGANQTNASNVVESASPVSGEDTGLKFTRCYFASAKNRNVHMGIRGRNATFLDCVSYGAGNEGYLLESSDNRIINGAIGGCAGDGVAVKDWTNQILGTAVFGNANGINVYSTATLTQIIDCQIDRNLGIGIYTIGEATVIGHNILHANSQGGNGISPSIQIAAANCSVTGNVFGVDAAGSLPKPSYDIYVDSGITVSYVGGARRTGASANGSFGGPGLVRSAGEPASLSATVASAAAMTAPTARTLILTGTTTITSIAAGSSGQRLTLIFTSAVTVTDGSNLKLAGNFVGAANSTMDLVCDGTNWYERARSTNG